MKNIELTLKHHCLSLRRGTNFPLPESHQPECDVTPICDTNNIHLYVSLIGILQWFVELGRLDITCKDFLDVITYRDDKARPSCTGSAYLFISKTQSQF